jgi:hypothetical protein
MNTTDNCSGGCTGNKCATPCGTSCSTTPCARNCGAACGTLCAIQPGDTTTPAPTGGIGAGYRFAIKRTSPGSIAAIRFAVVVDNVFPGGPAHQAGILPADSIIKVDGEPIETSGPDIVEKVVTKIEGPIGTAVGVTVERETSDGPAVEITYSLVRASIGALIARSFQVGVPKCRACPLTDQPGKCTDCPDPVRVARAAAARGAAAQTLVTIQTTPSYPAFVRDILARSQQQSTENGAPDRAVTFVNARVAYQAAVRAAEVAAANLDQAAEMALAKLQPGGEAAFAQLEVTDCEELRTAGNTLRAAVHQLEQAAHAYNAAGRALNTGTNQTES